MLEQLPAAPFFTPNPKQQETRFYPSIEHFQTLPEIEQLRLATIWAALAGARAAYAALTGPSSDNLGVVFKQDATPKTKVDVASDVGIIKVLQYFRPQDKIITEESDYIAPLLNSNREEGETNTFFVDSCDGTRLVTEQKDGATVGVAAYDKDDNYHSAAIVHLARNQLAYASRGKGGHLVGLTESFEITGLPQRLSVDPSPSLNKATVAIDSLFTNANRTIKLQLMDTLTRLSMDREKTNMSFDLIGSNIGYQFDVARGATVLGITDCKGGDWDWRVGYPIIAEAGGAMIDPLTGDSPTSTSEVVIYGNRDIVELVKPHVGFYYANYPGFSR